MNHLTCQRQQRYDDFIIEATQAMKTIKRASVCIFCVGVSLCFGEEITLVWMCVCAVTFKNLRHIIYFSRARSLFVFISCV